MKRGHQGAADGKHNAGRQCQPESGWGDLDGQPGPLGVHRQPDELHHEPGKHRPGQHARHHAQKTEQKRLTQDQVEDVAPAGPQGAEDRRTSRMRSSTATEISE